MRERLGAEASQGNKVGVRMKLVPKDIETWQTAKEYVDTAVVPLNVLSLAEEVRESAEAVEFISLLTGYLERQFTGRILLFPPFTYLENENRDDVFNRLKNWEASILEAGFKHIFYITSTMEWRIRENELDGSVIWLPSIPLAEMNDAGKAKTIERQVKQLLPIFTQKWHENQ